MLVLSRKVDEKIYIGDSIEILIVSLSPGRVQVGVTAPRELVITRDRPAAGHDVHGQEFMDDSVGRSRSE